MHAAHALDSVQEDAKLLCLEAPFWKARPVEEGGKRFVFCEASNEAWDAQEERILKAALLGSRELYLAKGNIDIDHITMLGPRSGAANPREWEIGLPREVGEGDRAVFVKGEIYQKHPKADWFWKTVTEQIPPMRWFPSVGGVPVEHTTVVDPRTGKSRRVITKARWVNLAFAREPVNLSVPEVQVTPIGAFAKAVAYAMSDPGAIVCHCVGQDCGCLTKAVTAGYGTDAAGLSGGAALRRQSIQGAPIRATMAEYLQRLGSGACPHDGAHGRITHEALVDHFATCKGMAQPEARRMATRLLTKLSARLRNEKGE